MENGLLEDERGVELRFEQILRDAVEREDVLDIHHPHCLKGTFLRRDDKPLLGVFEGIRSRKNPLDGLAGVIGFRGGTDFDVNLPELVQGGKVFFGQKVVDHGLEQINGGTPLDIRFVGEMAVGPESIDILGRQSSIRYREIVAAPRHGHHERDAVQLRVRSDE